MKIRRIVTGHDSAGKAIVLSDGAAPKSTEFDHVPGLKASLLWQTEPDAQVGKDVEDLTLDTRSWVPAPGATNAMVIVFPSDKVMATPDFNPAAAGQEYFQKLPGLAEKFEMDSPGMHTTDSVDYAVVLDGEIELELDDGKTVTLQKHDVVVQNGTRHAWRNRTEKPVTMLFILIGANRTL